MPLPIPEQNESRDDFVSRCMADEKMNAEYPDEKQRVAVCEAQYEKTEKSEAKAIGGNFLHNSDVDPEEPEWSEIDKTVLPLKAFAWEAPGTNEEANSTWKYPHHWVKNATMGDDGVYVSGDMLLHTGGLNAAWAAANGARSGERAAAGVLAHLNKHRQDLAQAKTVADIRLCKSVLEPQFTVDKDTGIISGYASVWDIVDHHGDIVRRGAFAKSIKERVAAGKVPLMARHFKYGGDVNEAIGVINEAIEDEHGLYISAKLYDTQLAQEIRAKIIDSPNMYGLSIGYMHTKNGAKKIKNGGYDYTEIKLYEVTVTVQPANEATIAMAKSEAQLFEDFRSELGLLRKMVDELAAKVSPVITDPADNHEQEPEHTEPKGKAANHSNQANIDRMRRTITLLQMECKE